MSTQADNDSTTAAKDPTAVAFRLEVVVIPIVDFDRAKNFYLGLDWRLDAEVDFEGYRLMQVTPPGSHASVIFGTQVTAAQPGSADGLVLVVDNIDAAREDLTSRNVDVSDVFHDANGGVGGGFHIGNEGRASGRDPQGRSYASYASFQDTEGNRWILQEITERFPGRI